jgi:hypothetical protein
MVLFEKNSKQLYPNSILKYFSPQSSILDLRGDKMKKSLLTLAITSMMFLSAYNANAGVGLSTRAVKNLADGHVLASAIGGGLGAASIVHGVRLVQSGRVGWGVFFLVLAENEVISSDDVQALEGLDVSSKEAFLEIISSEESEEAKAEMLAALFA